MAFFRISDCDESVLETEILREIKRRDLPTASDANLFGELNRRHSSLCQILRDNSVFAREKHIEAQNDYIVALERLCNERGQVLKNYVVRIENLEKRRCELEEIIESYKQHIETIQNTLSWRITKPIRLMKQLLTKKAP